MKIFDHSLSSYLSIVFLIVIVATQGYLGKEVEDIAYKCYVGEYFATQYQFPTVLVAPELLIYQATGMNISGVVESGTVNSGIVSSGVVFSGISFSTGLIK